MYSYALNQCLYNPSGSTNYSKLANVSLDITPSQAAVNAAGLSSASPGVPLRSNETPLEWWQGGAAETPFEQHFVGIFIANNWNIARVANGSLGHPTL